MEGAVGGKPGLGEVEVGGVGGVGGIGGGKPAPGIPNGMADMAPPP